MSSPLRTLARHRWQQNAEHKQRRDAMRRMWSLFFLSLAVTLCGLLTVKIVAQNITAHDRAAIEGALHGQ
jgi:FtsH-binding integral membrane protein